MGDLDQSGIVFNIKVTVKPKEGCTFIWATNGGGPDSDFCVAYENDRRSNEVVDPGTIADDIMEFIESRRDPADNLWRVTAVEEANSDLHI